MEAITVTPMQRMMEKSALVSAPASYSTLRLAWELYMAYKRVALFDPVCVRHRITVKVSGEVTYVP